MTIGLISGNMTMDMTCAVNLHQAGALPVSRSARVFRGIAFIEGVRDRQDIQYE